MSRSPQDEGEEFDLDNVSGSDDQGLLIPAAPAAINPVAQVVNDPEPSSTKKNAAQDVWHFFTKAGGYSVCQVCKRIRDANPGNWPAKTVYQYKEGNSTTTLRGHIEREHQDDYMKLIKEKGWKVRLRSQGKFDSEGSATSSLVRPDRFNQEIFQSLLVRFIIVDDQAINLVECPEFWELLLLLRPDLKDMSIPHRTKLHELVIEGWKQSFRDLKRELAAAVGQISFTMDIWSDQNCRCYMAITAHWIAMIPGTTSLELKAALIAFHRLCCDHSGESLAEVVLQLLDRAGITVKVGHFTLDNAANNKIMMEALQRKLNERDITIDVVDCRIMCYAHIINLSSGRVIRAAATAGEEQVTLESNPIEHARGVVL